MPEISVIVPAYRERENVPALLRALDQALAGLDWETIIVVDDALDGPEEVVRAAAQQDRRVRCLRRIGRQGLASACIEGMLASSAPYLAVMDADMQHDETLLPKLLDAARSHSADIVVASRYMPGGSTGELASDRVRISRLASALSRVLCQGLTDPMSGFFVVRRAFLERVVRKLYGRGFKILLDMIAAARGEVSIQELPYRVRSRERGESKLGARVVAEFFMLILYHVFGRMLPGRFFLFVPEEAVRFFETSVMNAQSSNAWVAFIQGELRHRYAVLLARFRVTCRPMSAPAATSRFSKKTSTGRSASPKD